MKKILLTFLSALTIAASLLVNAQEAITSSIDSFEIDHFNTYPINVQRLIRFSLPLTSQHLTYQYASSDPKNGGMDCAGTVHYVLSRFIKNVPYSSNGFYEWALKEGRFIPYDQKSPLDELIKKINPGDLLFWTGTYTKIKDTGGVTHIMIYLGTLNNQPIMFGSSDGRTYKNKKMWGVSIFDFKLPKPGGKSRFIGFSCIPNWSC